MVKKNQQKYINIAMLGLMSGFTLMISGGTLNFWISVEGLSEETIGKFSLVLIPYSINFLWSPIFDSIKLPILHKLFGHRISWSIFLQISLGLTIYGISLVSPKDQTIFFALLALLISFFASAQDSVLGALRTEIVKPKDQGAMSGIYIFGYRLGMFLSGYLAFYASEYLSFSVIYKFFSLIVLLFPIVLTITGVTIGDVKEEIKESKLYEDLIKSTKKILSNIGGSYKLILVILFLLMYRLPDNFIMAMINKFLLSLYYTKAEIATIGKLFGSLSVMVGGLIASYIMKKKNIFDSLILFGSVHAIVHVLYSLLAYYGKSIGILSLIVGLEGITGGICMAAYCGFIASLCSGKYRATQYSFFSSMMGFSRAIFPSISGYLVISFGWEIFFIITSILAIPSLVLAIYLKKTLNSDSI